MKTRALLPLILLFPCMLTCHRIGKVRVGIMTKLESGSHVGTSEINAARLYLDSHPDSRIEIVPFDDGWKPDKTKEAFAKLEASGIDLLITSHVSTCAVAIADDINRAKVLTFVTGAATDQLTAKDDYIIRTIPDVREEQTLLARHVNSLNIREVVIIRDTDNFAYTEPALRHFTASLTKPVSGVIPVSIGALDMPRLQEQIPRGSGSLVYILVGGYNTAAGAVAQLAVRKNPDALILFTPWMKTPALLDTLGSAVRNCIMPSHYQERRSNPAVNTLIQQFRGKFGQYPTYISLNVYSAMGVLDQALREGHRSPEAIKRYIINQGTFTTDLATFHFNATGDTTGSIFFIRDIQGEF